MAQTAAPKGTHKNEMEDLIVEYVSWYRRKNGYSPSLDEIATHFKRSITYVRLIINGVSKDRPGVPKRLKKTKGRARSLQVVEGGDQ